MAEHRERVTHGAEVIPNPDYAKTMKNPFLITGVLSIALWVTIREQAFEADPFLATIATVLLLGYGLFGVFSSLRKKPDQE